MGSKIFVNFTKYKFEECMHRLKEELISFEKYQTHENETSVVKEKDQISLLSDTNSINNNEIKITDWTELEVDKWLATKNINKKISENVMPCNGKILFQLYEMMISAPEFFFTSITSQDCTIPTREVASFS